MVLLVVWRPTKEPDMKRLIGLRRPATMLLLVAVLTVMTTVAVAAKSTDVVRWSGKATVTAVGVTQPGPSTFHYKRNGDIEKVVITTNEEQVLAEGLEAKCRGGDAAEEICAALNGSAVLSVHSSVATLYRPRLIDNPLSPYLPQVLQGFLRARLDAEFTSMHPLGSLLGDAPKIKAVGAGVYACANPLLPPTDPGFFLEIGACELGMGVMIPLGLKVVDTGKIIFTGGNGAFEDVVGGNARVIVTVKADAEGTTGTLRILKAKLRLQEGD